jgi:hypothetical protein
LLKLYYKFNFATEPKKLNLDDTEEGDLIHTDDDEKKPMKMDFLLLQCGIGNGKIILLKSSSTNGPYCCISDEILNLKLSLYVVKCFNQV